MVFSYESCWVMHNKVTNELPSFVHLRALGGTEKAITTKDTKDHRKTTRCEDLRLALKRSP